MSTQTESVAKLRSDLKDAEKQLKALLEKRESYKSELAKIDDEERSLAKKLQESKAKLRALVAASTSTSAAPGSAGSAAAAKAATQLGVLQSVAQFNGLADALPDGVVFAPYRAAPAPAPATTPDPNTISGPTTEEPCTIADLAAARTVSTYPLVPGGAKRVCCSFSFLFSLLSLSFTLAHCLSLAYTHPRTQQGSPICDQYYVQVQPERVFLCVADGCNWGERPREAARIAAQCFVRFEQQNAGDARTARDCGRVLLGAMRAAHNNIIAGKSDIWDAGTTTLIGGMLVALEGPSSSSSSERGYGVCLLSIGDCKCFLWERATARVRDITVDNRGNLLDATDPGGRLGPYVDGGQPDTRNLSLFFERCREGDVLVLCSDGVHDNLDPSSLGVDPGALAPAFAGLGWDEACQRDYALAARVKRDFAAQRLADLINGKGACFTTEFGLVDTSAAPDAAAAAASDGGAGPVLETVCRDVTDYCMRVTHSSRDFMENNTRDKLPKDYKRFPGKMDHTTCVCVRVRFPSSSSSSETTAPPPPPSSSSSAV